MSYDTPPRDDEIEHLLILSKATFHGLGMRTMGEDGASSSPLILITVTGRYTQRNQLWGEAPIRSLEFAVAPEAAEQLAVSLLTAAARFAAIGGES